MKKQVFAARAIRRGSFYLNTIVFISFLSFFSPNNMYAQGSYALTGSTPFPTLLNGNRMVWGDFDTDGDMDVLYQNSNTSGVGIAYMESFGNGTYNTINAAGGTFAAGPFNGLTFTYIAGSSVTQYVVDFDNDGDIDIVEQTDFTTGRVLRNNSGSFSVSPGNPFPILNDATRMLFFDANSDGDIDGLYQTSGTSGVGIAYMENFGNGTYNTINAAGGTFAAGPFNGLTFTYISPSSQNLSMYPVDLDNDGDIDLVEQTANVTGRVLVNNSGSYAVAGSNPFPVLLFANRMVFYDADSDGDVDVLYQNSNASGSNIAYMQNFGIGVFNTYNANASGTFASGPFNGISFTYVSTGSPILFPIDFDNDGDFDLVEQTSNVTGRVIRQNGSVPYVTNKVPAHQSLSFPPADNIVLTFSEPVFVGQGNIYIRKLSDGSIEQTISTLANSAVTGSGTNTITINPPTDLNMGAAYYITFSDGALYDADNGMFGLADAETRVVEPYSSASFLSFTTAASLPVVLIDLSAEARNDKVDIEWKSSSETYNSHFIVERSADGQHFEEIGRVAGKQTTAFTQQYAFVDSKPLNGPNYYRLTQVDMDGRAVVLGIRSVRMQGAVVMKVYPNPAQQKVTLSFNGALPAAADLQVANAVGVVVKRVRIPVNAVRYELTVNDLPPGAYWLRLKDGEGEQRQLLMIAR